MYSVKMLHVSPFNRYQFSVGEQPLKTLCISIISIHTYAYPSSTEQKVQAFSLTAKLCTIIHTAQSPDTFTCPLIIGQDIMPVSVQHSYTICCVVLDHSRALIGTAQIGADLGPKLDTDLESDFWHLCHIFCLFMVNTRFSFQILAQSFDWGIHRTCMHIFYWE